MGKVENEQAMGIARCAGQANTLTTAAGSDIGFVDSNVGWAIAFGSDKATALSSTLIDKCHISVSRIGGLLKLGHILSLIEPEGFPSTV